MGKRPDYATVVYCNLIRSVYKNAPIIIGGIEAQPAPPGPLRLLVRKGEAFPFWWIPRRILFPTVWGNGPLWRSQTPWLRGSILRILPLSTGTVYKTDRREAVYDAVWLPSYDQVKENKAHLCGELFYPVPEHRCVFWKTSLRAVYGPSLCGPESSGKAPFHSGNGRRVRPSLYAGAPSVL